MDPFRLALNGSIDFGSATAQVADICACIDQHQALVVDLGSVTEANSAALAMIVECKAYARQANREVTFENLPASVAGVAEVCEVGELL